MQQFTVTKTDNGFVVTMPPKPKEKSKDNLSIDMEPFPKSQTLCFNKIEDVIEKIKEFNSTNYDEDYFDAYAPDLRPIQLRTRKYPIVG